MNFDFEIVLGTANLENNYGVTKANLLSYKNFNKIVENCESIEYLDVAGSYKGVEEVCLQKRKRTLKLFSKLYFHEYKDNFENTKLSRYKDRIVLIHNWDELSQYGKSRALDILINDKKNNKILGFGFSNYKNFYVPSFINHDDEFYIQTPLNILNQKNKFFIEKLKLQYPKIKIFARSIFLQGLLIDSTIIEKYKNNRDLIKFNNFCIQNRIENVKMCLAYLVSQKNIDGIVIGVNNFNQITEILTHLKDLKLNDLIELDWDYFASQNEELTDPRTWTI